MSEQSNEISIDVPTADPVDSENENANAETAPDPVEHATFASATSRDHVTVPNDIPEAELNPEPDAEASFVDPATYSDDVHAGSDAVDTGVSDSAPETGPESVVTGEAVVNDVPISENDATTLVDPGSLDAAAMLADIHKIVWDIQRDIESLRELVGEVGPVFEQLVNEAKEKGITGLIPLILSLRK